MLRTINELSSLFECLSKRDTLAIVARLRGQDSFASPCCGCSLDGLLCKQGGPVRVVLNGEGPQQLLLVWKSKIGTSVHIRVPTLQKNKGA